MDSERKPLLHTSPQPKGSNISGINHEGSTAAAIDACHGYHYGTHGASPSNALLPELHPDLLPERPDVSEVPNSGLDPNDRSSSDSDSLSFEESEDQSITRDVVPATSSTRHRDVTRPRHLEGTSNTSINNNSVNKSWSPTYSPGHGVTNDNLIAKSDDLLNRMNVSNNSEKSTAIYTNTSASTPVHNHNNIAKSREGTRSPNLANGSQSPHPDHLLNNASSKSRSPENEAGVEKWPFFLINVSLLFVNCAGRFHSLVMDQFMYQHSARAILGNDSITTSRHPCLNDSIANSTLKALVSEVESLTSTRLLHLDLTSYGIGILSNLVLGSLSSVLHRKLQLLIPTFGYLVRNVTVPVVIHWSLDIKWLYLGYAVDGICGNASGIYFGSYLYTTDVTPRNRKRTLSMAILMAAKGTVTASLNVASSHMIETTGFFVPAATSAGCVLASMFTVLLLPNRKPGRHLTGSKKPRQSLTRILGTLCQPLRSRQDSLVKKMVILGLLSFLATMIAHFGISKIRVLFFMNLPFCWDADLIGWFLFGREFICRVFIVVAVAAFHRCLPGVTLAVLGSLSYLGGMVMYMLAQTNLELYLAPVIGIGQSLPLAVVRGELSRLLDSSLQGPLFAAFAVMESISFAVGSLYLFVYKASISFYPRLVFAIGAGMTSFVVVSLIWFQVLWRRYLAKTVMAYRSINVPEGDESSRYDEAFYSHRNPDPKSINS